MHINNVIFNLMDNAVKYKRPEMCIRDRKYNTLERPVQQVFWRVAADTGYVGAVAFPRSPFGQDGFCLLYTSMLTVLMRMVTAIIWATRRLLMYV